MVLNGFWLVLHGSTLIEWLLTVLNLFGTGMKPTTLHLNFHHKVSLKEPNKTHAKPTKTQKTSSNQR